MFTGVTEAVGEVGGFSVTVRDDLRLYPIQTAEKGIPGCSCVRAARRGGSMINDDNSVTALAEAVTKVGRHEWPLRRTKTVDKFLASSARRTASISPAATSSPSSLASARWGYLVGAHDAEHGQPHDADGRLQAQRHPRRGNGRDRQRVLPGYEDELGATIRELVGSGIDLETVVNDDAIEAPFDTATVDLMASVLRAEDPHTVPYAISGGTDAEANSRPTGHLLLRVLAAEDAGRSRLLAAVPRCRRACPRRRAVAVRRPRPRPASLRAV